MPHNSVLCIEPMLNICDTYLGFSFLFFLVLEGKMSYRTVLKIFLKI